MSQQAGFLLGTILSLVVFYMVVYGIDTLLTLIDQIEQDETAKKKAIAMHRRLREFGLKPKVPENLDITEEELETKVSNQEYISNYESLFDLDLDSQEYHVTTFHQLPNVCKGCLKQPLIVLTILAVIGMGIGISCGAYVFMGRVCLHQPVF